MWIRDLADVVQVIPPEEQQIVPVREWGEVLEILTLFNQQQGRYERASNHIRFASQHGLRRGRMRIECQNVSISDVETKLSTKLERPNLPIHDRRKRAGRIRNTELHPLDTAIRRIGADRCIGGG